MRFFVKGSDLMLKAFRKMISERNKNIEVKKYVACGLSLSSMLFPLWLFFMTFCVDNVKGESFVPINLISFEARSIHELVLFFLLFVLNTVSFILLFRSIRYYFSTEKEYARRACKVANMNTFITGLYYVSGVVYCSIRNVLGDSFVPGKKLALPFVMSVVVSFAFAFVARYTESDDAPKRKVTSALARFELYMYSIAASLTTVIACLSDIFSVEFTNTSRLSPLELNGFEILKSYNSKSEGFQLIAFVILAMLIVICALSALSTVSIISKAKAFYGFSFASLVCSGVFTLLIGLFGKYYEIVQKMNEEKIFEWILQYITINNFDLEYVVKSHSFVWFIIVLVFVLIAIIRRPYSRGLRIEASLERNPRANRENIVLKTSAVSEAHSDIDFDPCPAFSELDSKAENLRNLTKKLEAEAFESPTLPQIVQFVVNYAKDSRLHLSYSASDIAAFIAGLGATRLTILQGMSGTGKTSLPKIFTEALGGRCDIIEIESSWRDKNELLGYYNEFSRMYTPKKFTQALYRACLDSERPTFIVLDEMNLSRIEYYFSDFLSLMENEEDKREIRLVNVGLFKEADEEKYNYSALVDGHTVKIPSNIWFVGTANRDESTFEISDKVYDRAHTMNFNKRAKKAISVSGPLTPRYVSAKTFMYLFENAKKNVSFDIDSCAVIKEVEELLVPYNISFGNRVSNQIEDFVKIYTACFTDGESAVNEAIETILLSKVVAKLEYKNIDNKRHLAGEFERLRLFKCSEFIMKLNED